MNITIDFWLLEGAAASGLSTLCGFGWMLLQMQSRRISGVEKMLTDTLVKLPLEYQRREDAIRFETLLNAKLDAIGARIERLMERSINHD